MTRLAEPSRDQIAALVRAVLDDKARQLTDAIVIARGVQRISAYLDDHHEYPAEVIRLENEKALAAMAALGNGRDAARRVAREWSTDPHRRKMLAQRFRRLRLKQHRRPK